MDSGSGDAQCLALSIGVKQENRDRVVEVDFKFHFPFYLLPVSFFVVGDAQFTLYSGRDVVLDLVAS